MRRVVISVLLLALSSAAVVEASILNLSGSLELNYSWSRDEQSNKVTKEVSDLQQRYNLRNFGDLFDRRLGTFMLSGTFIHQDIETRGDPVPGQKQYNNLRLMDYSASVNLLPRLWPLTFTVQRITQYNSSGSCYFFCSSGENTRKDRTTNYNLHWIIPINNLPTVRLNLSQTELKSNEGVVAAKDPIKNPTGHTDITTRFVNVEVSDRFKGINVVTRYQFSQTEFEGRDTTRANAVNLNLDGRITPALSLSASGNYTANQGGVNTSQVSFFQERGGRFALFYRPSSLWDGNLSYDLSSFRDTGVASDFRRHLAQGSFNLRPTTQVDIFSSLRFMRFEIGSTLVDSRFGTAGFNWRPVSLFGMTTFGLLTGLSLNYGDTSTAHTSNTTFQNYRGFISYTKGLDRFRLSTGYSVSFGANRTVPVQTGSTPTHRDLLNTANVALENTDVRLVHWVVSYAFTDTHRDGSTEQEQDDQRSHLAQVSADTGYFKNLFLQASASYTNIEGFGTEGRTIQLNARAAYFIWQGLSLAGEWNHQDFPGRFFGDSDIFTGDAQWFTTFWRMATLLFNVKEIYQVNQSTDDRQTFQARSQLMYQLGKLVLTLDYLWLKDEGIGTAAPLTSQNVFVRVIRTF